MAFTRPDVARMCVEMNIDEELQEAVWIEGHNYNGFWQPLFYPNFLYCSHCSKIGHSFKNCRKRRAMDKNKGKDTENDTQAVPLALPKQPNHPRGTIHPKHAYKATGNLFPSTPTDNQVLQEENPTPPTGDTDLQDINNIESAKDDPTGHPGTSNTYTPPTDQTGITHAHTPPVIQSPSHTHVSPDAIIQTSNSFDAFMENDKDQNDTNEGILPHTPCLGKQPSTSMACTLQQGATTPTPMQKETSSTSNPSRKNTSSPSAYHMGFLERQSRLPSIFSPKNLSSIPIQTPRTKDSSPLLHNSIINSKEQPSYNIYNEEFPPLTKDLNTFEDTTQGKRAEPSYGSDSEILSHSLSKSDPLDKRPASRAKALARG
ncbi:hypothetical protein FRX31_030570 [Thalictrum thalictroides]|uniref:Uncharacterized protein n=1 Tax=Thalictrum thalictroides TaxID=46969 RepID=A0A7J6V4F5_THATH|nr:hypothetical protein FRX31_030570 [Thalictrum thalictroides]